MIDDPNAVSAHDVLDHIRPTVVVRRRVWEPPAELRRPVPPPPAPRQVDPGDEDDDVEEDDDLDLDDDELEDDVAIAPAPEPEPESAPTPAPPSSPALIGRMLEVGDTIPLADLAHAMKRSRAEVAAELVGRGFFEVTGKAVLSHETACIAATAFGWSVLRVRTEAQVPAPRASGVRVAATKSRARKPVAPARKTSTATPAARKKAGRRAA